MLFYTFVNIPRTFYVSILNFNLHIIPSCIFKNFLLMGNLYGLFQEKSILKVFKPIQLNFCNSFTLCINCAHHTSKPIQSSSEEKFL